ncbi:MAG: hypothetical protein IIC82_09825 [Chloroflexi bacterium]|nr:hypothetical protein [Chloroflexota bacterium]
MDRLQNLALVVAVVGLGLFLLMVKGLILGLALLGVIAIATLVLIGTTAAILWRGRWW